MKRLVNMLIYYAQLDSEQILRENFKVDDVQHFGESIRVRLIVQEADVGTLDDVFDCLAVRRVVHKLEE